MNDFSKLLGQETLSVLQAMQIIDENAFGILFILSDKQKLLGCLTDGDIRRFILSGGNINNSVMNAVNRKPVTASNYDDAAKLYDSKNYIAIPIIDENGFISDIVSGANVIKRKKRQINLPVVINAGGRGTRLEPFTKILPKPLIPIGDIPIIEHIMNSYQEYGCNKFDIIVNYKKDLIKAYFSDIDKKYDITWFDEAKPLGTGGGLKLLKNFLNEPFFFINCDTLILADYADILRFHKESHNVITMVCAYKNIEIPYGTVEIGNNGEINNMREKPSMSFLTNTGMYIVEPEAIDEIENDEAVGFPTVVDRLREHGKKVSVYPIGENDWLDMGRMDELEKMRKRLCGSE